MTRALDPSICPTYYEYSVLFLFFISLVILLLSLSFVLPATFCWLSHFASTFMSRWKFARFRDFWQDGVLALASHATKNWNFGMIHNKFSSFLISEIVRFLHSKEILSVNERRTRLTWLDKFLPKKIILHHVLSALNETPVMKVFDLWHLTPSSSSQSARKPQGTKCTWYSAGCLATHYIRVDT